MGVTGSLSLRVRLLQCPGLHRGGGGSCCHGNGRRGPASPGPPGLLPPSHLGPVPRGHGEGPPSAAGREGEPGPGVPGGPGGGLSFQAPAERAWRSRARTEGGAGLPPWAASCFRIRRGQSLGRPGVWWLAVGVGCLWHGWSDTG